MKNVLLATMPCTGTRFFASLLSVSLERVACWVRPDTMNKYPDWETLVIGHIQANKPILTRKIYEYIDQYDPIIVTTQRNTEDHINSWHRVGLTMPCWEETKALHDHFITQFNPHILRFDTDDKDTRLTKLSLELGVKLQTDWQWVNDWGEQK